MNHVILRDEAVSPVVGVMLMLVVTIIIAAVVSGFAGGLAGENQKAPQASIVASDFVIKNVIDTNQSNRYGQGLARPDQGAGNPAADIYVLFEHKGGDALNLDMIEIYLGKLSEPQLSSQVSRALSPQIGPNMTTSQGNFGTIGLKASIPGWSASWDKYIQKYPDKTNVILKTGDRFVLHADYGARVSNESYVAWHKQAGEYGFPIKQGDVLTYDIIDKNSKKIISSGQIAVPEFAVASS